MVDVDGRCQLMTGVIELLREEHRDIERLLLVLEEELRVFDRTKQPDYEIMQAVVSYFQDYPDCCHHPKEDMIFEKLEARDPVAAESVGNLEAEHQHEATRLRRVADMMWRVRSNHEIVGQTFDGVMHDFIAHEREHMQMEERILFPAAVNALRSEDWKEIELKWMDKKDSLFNVGIEEKCRSLRDRILQWRRKTAQNRI